MEPVGFSEYKEKDDTLYDADIMPEY